jgi:general secretion pathway protein F
MSASSEPATFHVVVLDHAGRLANRLIEADSIEHAQQLAGNPGETVLECTPATAPRPWQVLLAKFRVINQSVTIDTVAFSQDLATLLQAGVTVREAVGALAKRESSASRRQVLNSLNASMAQGLSFSKALGQSNAFPQLLVATISASEQTGDLAVGLSRYAAHQQSLRSVRDRVVAACVYPMLLLTVGSLVVLLLLGVVVPRFSTLISDQGRKLPLLSKLLMDWGQFVDKHAVVPFLLLFAFVAAVAFFIAQWKSPELRKKWLERIPGVTRVVREFQHLQLYRTTAILTARGITLHQALTYSMELLGPTDRARLRAGLIQLREGVAISRALSGCGLADVVATSMLSVAERSGALSEMLDRIADFYERSLQRNIDMVSRLIEPVLMIIFGIVIGGLVVLMYLPIFDLASSIS